MGERQTRIESTLAETFELLHLEVVNESGGHNVPDGSETHFKTVLVADAFEGMRPLARHRQVNKALQAEFDSGLHALAIHVYTPDEWRARHGEAPMSPPCAGGH